MISTVHNFALNLHNDALHQVSCLQDHNGTVDGFAQVTFKIIGQVHPCDVLLSHCVVRCILLVKWLLPPILYL